MYIGDIIRQYREENHISLRVFANKCEGITHGYLAALEAGKNPRTGKPSNPSIEKLEAIAKGMDISIDELLDMMGEKKKPSLIVARRDGVPQDFTNVLESMINEQMNQRINERIRQGEIAGIDAIPYTTPRAMVPIVGVVRCGPGGLAYEDLQGAEVADVANVSDYFYLRVEGNSMEPDIKAGDLVLVHIQPEVESGELAVIIIDGEEGMLKKYMKKDNAIILQSFNQAYPPRVFVGEEMNLVHVAGKVVESKRKW